MSERMSFSSDVDPDGKTQTISSTDETIKQVGNKLSKLDFTNNANFLQSNNNSSSSNSTPGSTPSPGVILNMQQQSSQHYLTNGGLNLSSVRLSASNSSSSSRFSRNSTQNIFLPEWEHLNHSSSKDTVSYTFISYNVLAQAHLLANQYLYKKNKRQHLQWETRFIKLTNFFEKYPADIYCLQEVEKAHLSQYNCYFDHACMNYFYENRPGGKPDGCLIAYNPVAFTKLDHYRVDYSDGNPMANVSDNVGQIAVFKVNAKISENINKIESQKSENIIIVVNTHIVYSPKNGHVKLWQIIKLLDSIRQVKEIYKDWNQSIVFSGDFNAVANSGLWSLIVDGKIDTSRFTRSTFSNQKPQKRGGQQQTGGSLSDYLPNHHQLPLQNLNSPVFSHKLDFKPVYDKSDVVGYYTQTDSNGIVVDHVFHNGIKELSRLSLWSLNDYRPNQLPGDVYGSDHMPVGFKFELLKTNEE